MKLCVVTYNIRNCRGVNGKVSLTAVASTLAGIKPDIVGLQEVDCFNPRSGFANQAAKLGGMLGMHHVYGPNVTWGCIARFGNAVLSRYPIINWQNYLLPSRGQQRGLLFTEIKLGRESLFFLVTHLGLNHQERIKQVDKILKTIAGVSGPLLFCGDLNARPGDGEVNRLQNVLQTCDLSNAEPTFPADYPKYKIDYIFYSTHWMLAETKVVTSHASDHLPLAAAVELVHVK